MKTDTVFKRAYNDALDLLSKLNRGEPVPPESKLTHQLGVSRTTVRKVLIELADRGVVLADGRKRVVRKSKGGFQRFPKTETVDMADQVERRFMEWMLRGNVRPGTVINELELARQFKVATTGIREFLNRFQRFGLIEKRPNAGWIFKGFTNEFALELFEIREMFEFRSARAFAALPNKSPLWQQLDEMRLEHVQLLKEIATRYHDFSDLDRRFHLLINSASTNRFITDFYDIISMVFHYHYQWNKQDERQRNEAALREHISYIDALKSHNWARTETTCALHLASAKTTLLRSTLQWDGAASKSKTATAL